MEKNKRISIVLLTILLIVTILIICIMGYFINMLYVENLNIVSEQENLQSQIENLENEKNLISQNNNINNELSVENSYKEFANKLISQRSNSSEDWYRSTEQLDTGDDITIIIDNKGDAYLQLSGELANTYGERYKVLENVLMCKFVRFNQDVTNYLYFICDDGTVKIIQILANIEISSDNLNDYKDIVNIITTLDMNVVGFEGLPVPKVKLIDINGNIYNVN